MSNYRDDREAARARIEELEAQIRDLTAAQEARDAELALHRRGAFLRSPRWTPLAAALALLFLLVGILDLRVRSSAEPSPPKVAPSPAIAEPSPPKVITLRVPPSDLPRPQLGASPAGDYDVELCYKAYDEMLAARAGAGESTGGAHDDSLFREFLKSCVLATTPSPDTDGSDGGREGP